MKILIWISMTIFIPLLVYGDYRYRNPRNPYEEALLAHPWESKQGYLTLRDGAYMFYWLYYADGTKRGAVNKPLVIWIQGGPGLAASGIANFAEIGPLTMDFQQRNHTWVKGRNVLLLDHPIGTGFSIVRHPSHFVRSDEEAALDLSSAIGYFMMTYPEFGRTPTYIVGQNYGGKLVPIVAHNLQSEIEQQHFPMNFKGIVIGNGFVNPKESIMKIPEFLYIVGLIDQTTFMKAQTLSQRLGNYTDVQDYVPAMSMMHSLGRLLTLESGMFLNFDNILKPDPNRAMETLARNMNAYVKPTLHQVVYQNDEWKLISHDARSNLYPSILIPTTKYLERVLNRKNLKVVVYNGNLVADVPVAGATSWVNQLNWHGSEEFKKAERQQIRGINNGHYKEAKQLSLWWVLRAGLWVPEDNPEAMEHILEYLMSDVQRT